MNRVFTFLLAASSIASSYAACNKNCYGKGTCGAYDRCTCFHAFDVASAQDCSQRVCPFGTAWGVNTAQSNRPYRECSDQGVCNRGTGECECFEGFTGSSCQRTTCPSSCSGHGQCQTIGTWGFSAQWDSDMTQACRCDPGYEGPACNMRKCPRGDDPLSTGQVDEVQQLIISSTASMDGTFALQLQGWDGQVFTTRALNIDTVSSISIAEAIQALPNNAFPQVTVSSVTRVGTTDSITFSVTFSATENAGGQTPIVILKGDANTDDHANQPIYRLTGGTITPTVTVTTAATEEGLVCSGRGSCDSDTGLCACHQGFYGHSCAMQTALQ